MQDADFDAGDRVVAQSTGAQTLELTGTSQESKVFISYTDRGTVKQVTSSFGILVDHVYRDADGLVTQIEYGDVAKTTTDFTYDNRRRVKTVQTHRGPPASWTTPSTNYLPAPTYSTDPTSSFQLILQDDEFTYDAVDNPVEIRDWRNPAEWPTSAKPVTRKMQYDDLNRVTQIEYQYPTATGKDPWKSPFTADFEAGNEDPRMAKPSPHQVFDNRPLVQSFAFDWLGNTTKTDDDAHGFYDRSLGKITNNSEENRPCQLVSAKQNAGDHTGNLQAAYDDAGNLIDLAVMRHGPCFPAGAGCSQRFVYKWDEVGRLVQARRWDISTPQVLDPEPKEAPAADLSYRYDASDNRVVKTARDDQGETVYTVYIFGSLELRRARFLEPDAIGATPDYELNTSTEVGYLFAHGVRLARLHWDADGSPAVGGANLHVLFELGDHLGSSSKVLDKATSELVEASTYMGYGQAESDYRPGRWKSFREDYRFTGKEEDSEVGLTYFGKRFLSSALGRWVSADPLSIHANGADLNVYTYVRGALLKAVDSSGLSDDVPQSGWAPTGVGDAFKSLGEWVVSLPFRTFEAGANVMRSIAFAAQSFISANAARKEGEGAPTLRFFEGLGETISHLLFGGVVLSAGIAIGIVGMSRNLSAEEIKIAKENGAPDIDFSKILVRDRWSVIGNRQGVNLFAGKGKFVYEGVIYGLDASERKSYPDKYASDLVHEVVHVAQEQKGVFLAMNKLFHAPNTEIAYEIADLVKRRAKWSEYNMEQRAEFISSYGNILGRYGALLKSAMACEPECNSQQYTLEDVTNGYPSGLGGSQENMDYIVDLVQQLKRGELSP